jgi:hypothetical protein
MMRAIEDSVDPGPFVGEHYPEPLVNREDHFLFEISARDPSLIRYDCDPQSGPVQEPDGLRAAGKEPASRDVIDISHLFTNGSIPIEEYARVAVAGIGARGNESGGRVSRHDRAL